MNPTTSHPTTVSGKAPADGCLQFSFRGPSRVLRSTGGLARLKRQSPRIGLSLIEVIIALGILTFSALALAQLASTGRQHLNRAVKVTQAQNLCESKMAEVVAGIALPSQNSEATPFVHDEAWSFTIRAQPAEMPGLTVVEVAVMPTTSAEFADTGAKPAWKIVQWFRESQVRSNTETGELPFESEL